MIFVKTTKSKLWASKAIRFLTRSRSSHFIVEFSNMGLVFHNNFFGFDITTSDKFFEGVQEVSKEKLLIPESRHELFYNEFVKNINYNMYDFGAFFYFAIRTVLRFFFFVPYPKRNIWDSRNGALCTEIAKALNKAYISVMGKDLIDRNVDTAITLPEDLIYIIKRKQRG